MNFLWLILQQLKSENPEKRLQAVQRLAEMESVRSLEGLAEAAVDKDIKVREAALVALGGIAHPRAKELHLRAMHDPHPEVRQAAVSYLRDDGSEQTHEIVRQALRDYDPGVRARAARFLERSSWRPKEVEDEIWLAIAHSKFHRAASLGAAAIQPLASVLDGSGFSQQAAAVEALATIPDERVLKPLRNALKSPEHVVCLAAIGAVCFAGGQDVIKDIIPLFKHEDHRIRAAAIEAAGRFEGQVPLALLQEGLRDPRWEVQCAAANALGKTKDPSAADLLVALLKDQSSDVRSAAADALGNVGDTRTIGALVLSLRDNDSEVRKMTVSALTRIDSKWTASEAARNLVPELRKALSTVGWAGRQAAAYALEQLGERPTATTLELPGTNVATTGRRRQQAVLAVFTDLLRDVDADVRLIAVDSLSRLGGAETRSPLMTALSDTDDAVKLAAGQALAGLGMV